VEICGVNDGLLRDFICKLGPEAWIYQIRSNRIGARNNRTKKTQSRDGGSKVGEGDGICKLGDFTGSESLFLFVGRMGNEMIARDGLGGTDGGRRSLEFFTQTAMTATATVST
jgi:hypothetical protein